MRLGRRFRRGSALTAPLHELRGALSALDLGLTGLARQCGERDGAKHLDALRLQLRRATDAVAEIERLRCAPVAARTPARVRRIELGELVPMRVRAWARLAPAYGATLALDWRAGRALVAADPRQLEQALDNLIANALEHGGGRVLVEGELRGATARVAVSDGGPGPSRLPAPGRVGRARAAQRGHGLGLVVDAVARCAGTTTLGSGRNGPAVVIELPIAVRSARALPARARRSPSRVGEAVAGARRAA